MSDTGPESADSKYAWRQLPRADLPKRSPAERVADFLEIYGAFDEATAREQASRCLQCPEPICVTGCPLSSRIPEWLALTAEGHFLEAAAVLQSTSNMPEICVRVCAQDRTCEGQCILSGRAEPVSIGALERFLADYAFAHGAVDTSIAPPNGMRVAVVGAGPGGLTCADELVKRGYEVTVFESKMVPGGLLVNGVPAFKLDRTIVRRRIEILEQRGVKFRLGVNIGEDADLGTLQSEFDAIFLGLGGQKARPLPVPGAELEGVVQAVPFIVQKSTNVPLEVPPLEMSAKRVVVLGGGDTAMDCLRTAIRCGASQAICVYRRDQANMPCSRREFENALEEGARFVFLAAPVELLGNAQGRVSGLRMVRTELGPPDESGRAQFTPRPGTEFTLETDWVVVALGFDPLPLPLQGKGFSRLARNQWGGLQVDSHQMTNIPGVFAGGHIVRGPSMVLDAVRDARKAAAEIHCYLLARQSGNPA